MPLMLSFVLSITFGCWICYNVAYFSYWLLFSNSAKERKNSLKPEKKTEKVKYEPVWNAKEHQYLTDERELWIIKSPGRNDLRHPSRGQVAPAQPVQKPPPMMGRQKAKQDVEAATGANDALGDDH